MSSLYWYFRALFKVVFTALNRIEGIGCENVPETGGVIIAANHVSYLDPLVVGVALKRRATYMAMEKLFSLPLIGAFVKAFSLPVRTGRPQTSTIKEAVNRLKQGELIVIFPEGGRSADGSIMDPKRGVGVIAGISRAPVIPTLVTGTEKSLPVGAKFMRPAKIKVVFGRPIEIKREETDRQFHERICRNIMEELRKLKGRV